jgi:hypothetical protein
VKEIKQVLFWKNFILLICLVFILVFSIAISSYSIEEDTLEIYPQATPQPIALTTPQPTTSPSQIIPEKQVETKTENKVEEAEEKDTKITSEKSNTQPTKITIKPTPKPTPTLSPSPKIPESKWYIKKIPMKKEHQKLLWDYCVKRKLDYIDMLSVISLESNFNEKSSSGRYKGYFQISSKNAPNLAKTLKTPNNPLDGKININWGTAIFQGIMQDKRVKNAKGNVKKIDIALSIFQRGSGGYDRSGINRSFIKVFYRKRSVISSYLK